MAGCLGLWFIPILLVLMGCAALKTTVYYDRALKAFQEQRYEEAEVYLHSALEQNPQDEKSLSLQGWTYFKRGQLEEAEKFFEKANRANPENIGAIEGLAWIHYTKGRNETSEEKFRKMIQYAENHLRNPYWTEYPSSDQEYIHSLHSNASYGLGLIAKRTGGWHLARKYLEEAIHQPNQFINPEEMRPDLAEILFGLAEYGPALMHYQKLLSGRETHPFLLNRYAWCLYHTGKVEEAKSLFLKSKNLFSSDAEFYRDSATPQNTTEKLLAKRIAEPYYGLALIYAKEKNLQEAIKELTLALNISPFFHHPEEIVTVFSSYSQWQERLRPHLIGRPLP
ncbi:MAG: tetratricopeptide repeat protein [Thermodesulfobacteriota bacterium]|nr:tetratricopeptide repeat protein [Thermodesulfobacteriota bacterium]